MGRREGGGAKGNWRRWRGDLRKEGKEEGRLEDEGFQSREKGRRRETMRKKGIGGKEKTEKKMREKRKNHPRKGRRGRREGRKGREGTKRRRGE